MTVQDLLDVVDHDLLDRITEFVHHEADLADDHRYREWLALWDPACALYLVPYGDVGRGRQRVSLIRDDYARLTARVTRMTSGEAHSQDPPSALSRVIGRVRPVARDGVSVTVTSKFVCTESRPTRALTVWSGTVLHTVAETESGLRLQRKEVRLVNIATELPPLTFLI
jgi:3-phenylpropionate/cinnamic acid dioxygenase small subunit